MITCPHCGFKQPKDVFCAKCGIDIDNYTPEKKPFLKTLTESSLFYIVLLLAVVSMTTFFAYEKILTHLKKETSDPFSSQLDYIPMDRMSSPTQNQTPYDDVLLDSLPSQETKNQASGTIATQTNTPTNITNVTLTSISKTVRVYFVILPRDIPLFQTQTAELRDGQYGIIFNFAQAFAEIPDEEKDIIIQHSWEVETNSGRPQINTFSLRGNAESEENNGLDQIGIIMEMLVQEMTATQIILRSEINVFLAEGNRENRRSYQDAIVMDRIELNSGNATFIFGLLPHRLPSPIEQEELPEALRLLMESDDFIQLNTELFIIVEYVL